MPHLLLPTLAALRRIPPQDSITAPGYDVFMVALMCGRDDLFCRLWDWCLEDDKGAAHIHELRRPASPMWPKHQAVSDWVGCRFGCAHLQAYIGRYARYLGAWLCVAARRQPGTPAAAMYPAARPGLSQLLILSPSRRDALT